MCKFTLRSGLDPGFFLGGGVRQRSVSFFVVVFFCRIPVILESSMSSHLGGG